MTGDVESYLLYRESDAHNDYVGYDGWDEDDEFEDEAGRMSN